VDAFASWEGSYLVADRAAEGQVVRVRKVLSTGDVEWTRSLDVVGAPWRLQVVGDARGVWVADAYRLGQLRHVDASGERVEVYELPISNEYRYDTAVFPTARGVRVFRTTSGWECDRDDGLCVHRLSIADGVESTATFAGDVPGASDGRLDYAGDRSAGHLSATDPAGQLRWRTLLPPGTQQMSPRRGGGLLAAGAASAEAVELAAWDGLGSLVWSSHFEHFLDPEIEAVVEAYDGGAVVSVRSTDLEAPGTVGSLLRVDAEGELMWRADAAVVGPTTAEAAFDVRADEGTLTLFDLPALDAAARAGGASK
jgi:hypothetical protein